MNMYTLLNKIRNCNTKFKFDDSQIYLLIDDTLNIVNKEDFTIQFEVNLKTPGSIYLTLNDIIIKNRRDEENPYYFIDKLSGKILNKKLPYSNVGIAGVIDDSILYKAFPNNSLSKKLVGLWNNGSTLWEIESEAQTVHFVKQDKIYQASADTNSLGELQEKDGSFEWIFPNVKGYERKKTKVLHISESQLIGIYNSNKIRVISFSERRIVKEWSEIPTYVKLKKLSQNGLIPGIESCKYLDDEKKICGLHSDCLWELDLKTDNIVFYDLSKELEDNEIRTSVSGEFSISEEHLIFYSKSYKEKEQGGIKNINKIVALNRKSKKIDWVYNLEGLDNLIFKWGAPIVDGDLLYVLDSQKNLYIFKKDKAKMKT